MSSITDYFTADKASEGLKIDLPRPDGAKSTDWAVVRGEDSPEYKAAYAETMRDILERGAEDAEAKLDGECRLAVALIKKWSFEQPVTAENVKQVVVNAPYLWEAIQKASYDRSSFIAKKPKASSTTQRKSSNSRAKSKAGK